MSTLRQRTKFVTKDSDDETPAPILDDEEQEKIIEEIRQSNTFANAINIWLFRASIALSLGTQLQFLFDTSGRHPLSTIAARLSDPQPLIPLAKVFTLLSIALHVNVLFLLATSLSHKVPLTPAHAFALSTLAPVVAIVSRTGDWAQLLWWTGASLLMAGVEGVVRWINESEGDVARLEKLRYDFKGA